MTGQKALIALYEMDIKKYGKKGTKDRNAQGQWPSLQIH
jgi:hypothetical protein